jgi:hypothetical protein
MKLLSCIVATLGGMATLNLTARTFTSADGKTIEAEVVSADGLQATLKLSDGRQAVVPFNRLSEADQAFLAGWIKEHPQAIRYSFTVDATKDKLESKTASTGDSLVKGTATKWLYHVKITNRASQPIEGLKMRYQIHYVDVDGNSKSVEFKSGAKDVDTLKPGGSTSVDTDPVELLTTQLDGGFVYGNGARSKQADTIKGLAVTLEHNGKAVHEFTTGGVKKVEDSAADAAGKKARPQ